MIEPTSRAVGAAPLFRALADAIGVVSIVNRLVAWDPRQCRVSPGERILLLLWDILAGNTPRSRLAERLPLTTGHFDTTSRSVAGALADADAAAVHPAYGYSKDHRPDLKQLLMTLVVNHEGIPLCGTVESGHRSDKTLHAEMIDRRVDALSPAPWRELIYVADSAWVTGPNLARLAAAGIPCLSRCPETFTAVAAAKAAAWVADAWSPVGRLALRADGATYEASEPFGVIDGRADR